MKHVKQVLGRIVAVGQIDFLFVVAAEVLGLLWIGEWGTFMDFSLSRDWELWSRAVKRGRMPSVGWGYY